MLLLIYVVLLYLSRHLETHAVRCVLSQKLVSVSSVNRCLISNISSRLSCCTERGGSKLSCEQLKVIPFIHLQIFIHSLWQISRLSLLSHTNYICPKVFLVHLTVTMADLLTVSHRVA